MRDYAELVKAWQYCAVSKTCDGCPMQKNCPEISHQIVAADAIEELLAKVPKWISVEERMPHYLDHVLCVNKFGIQMVGYLTDYKEGGFRCESGMDSCDYITHWMPLPAPPKGDAECKN